ncbi:MAG TPA: UbiA-like polyprenyltransferase [Anaeromyxobacteraceae bacterium]|nr:UbiA-like polyprenyltransferase [Anaeromyxobacteraceae bacterium]
MTIAVLFRLVKFEHSLFALPFAAAALVLVAPHARLEPARLILVALAIVAARTAAMAMNRIVDRHFDAANPRTERRELPTGAVSLRTASALLAVSAASFLAAAAAIAPLCGVLALPVLAVLLGYSYAKRFTWAAHLWLGMAQALGPIGVAIALTGRVPPSILALGAGVGAWVAGFDILYSLQDREFDERASLKSIPVRFGVAGALWWARLLHAGAAAAIPMAGFLAGRGAAWLFGSALMTVIMAAEHAYLTPNGQLRPERIGAAFFNFNALASLAFAACALADLALRSAAP